MRTHYSILAVAGATMLAMAFLQGSAQAAPKGWQCGYASQPRPIYSPVYFTCYGKSLSETKARARAECRRLSSCEASACLPLDSTPRRRCERE
jgi:hypothetical protein